MSGALPVGWRPREVPLAPAAVAARGPAAIRLVERLLTREDEVFARLRGVAAPDLVLLLGEPEVLPWADGVRYLGRDSAAPSLLLPTNREPHWPAALVERAVRRASAGVAPPVAVLLDEGWLIGLAGARPLERERLVEWLEASR